MYGALLLLPRYHRADFVSKHRQLFISGANLDTMHPPPSRKMASWAMRMNPTISGAEAAAAVEVPSTTQLSSLSVVSDMSTASGIVTSSVDYDLATPEIFIETQFDYIIIGE
jgi:hypothetical protein